MLRYALPENPFWGMNWQCAKANCTSVYDPVKLRAVSFLPSPVENCKEEIMVGDVMLSVPLETVRLTAIWKRLGERGYNAKSGSLISISTSTGILVIVSYRELTIIKGASLAGLTTTVT